MPMNFFQWRRYRKYVKHLLHEAHHARHMREDICDPDSLQQLKDAESDLRSAWKQRDVEKIEQAADRIGESIGRVFPPRKWPKIRENVEILAVALAVAMGFRTYIIQPFKIPTGSMQPTLYGITVKPQEKRSLMDVPPLNFVRFILFGERYFELKARSAGPVRLRGQAVAEYIENEIKTGQIVGRTGLPGTVSVFDIGGVLHLIHPDMNARVVPGQEVVPGQVLASGVVKYGDHIFVDKIRWNFARPKRGDVIVFSTDHIDYKNIRPNSFYIKRLVGLPGERVSIDPPHLVVDGRKIEEPYPFKRLLTEPGYVGYNLARAGAELANPWDVIDVGNEEFLPFGDNTDQSLDGRYFGPVTRQSLVGPAFFVYWPFTKRWGIVR